MSLTRARSRARWREKRIRCTAAVRAAALEFPDFDQSHVVQDGERTIKKPRGVPQALLCRNARRWHRLWSCAPVTAARAPLLHGSRVLARACRPPNHPAARRSDRCPRGLSTPSSRYPISGEVTLFYPKWIPGEHGPPADPARAGFRVSANGERERSDRIREIATWSRCTRSGTRCPSA